MVENHPVTLQKKLLAVHHWRVLAAELVSKLEGHEEFAGKTLYVDVLRDETEFSQAFGKLVISTLTERGFRVVSSEQGADLRLIIGNQVVLHGRRYGIGFNATTGLSALALGVRNVLAGDDSGSAGQTRGELLVTSWIHHGNRVHYCANQIAYITPKDASLYLSESEWEKFRGREASERGFKHWFSESAADVSRG
ncbi:MAG: hypothetical protein JHC85_07455 [Chthoniobacterales bacterium]|nr:hypothetical protein [Chthoniobacterales bacterium]